MGATTYTEGMVSPAFLAHAMAMPAEDRWEIVEALLGTLDQDASSVLRDLDRDT